MNPNEILALALEIYKLNHLPTLADAVREVMAAFKAAQEG